MDSEVVVSPPEAVAEPRQSLGDTLRKVMASPAFWPGVAIAIGLCAMFYSTFFQHLRELWDSEDGYYSHGYIVPLISAYIVYRWWPKLQTIPVRPSMWALIPIILMLPLYWASYVTNIQQVLALLLLGYLLCFVWFIAGGRWMLRMSPPILYLAFILPLWTGAIDATTNPLQILSTKVSYYMLKLGGFNVFMDGNTRIIMDNFTFEVAVACSGLKLLLAVTAFTIFFCLIGGLKWWGNAIMLFLVLPLSLFINGLRVALIGVVGEYNGSEAAAKFHDYSGYITLIVCFFILFRIARWLGWKD